MFTVEETAHVWGQKVYRNSLYFPLNSAVINKAYFLKKKLKNIVKAMSVKVKRDR